MESLPPGEGHSSSCPLGRGRGGGVSRDWRVSVGRDVVEKEGGAGASTPASFRLVCASVLPPPRWKPHLPAPNSPSSRPPLSSFPPALSAFCPRCLDRRRSFPLGNKKRLFSTEGWIRASTAEGKERFYRVFWPLEQRLMFTVSANSEACFQTPRLV